MNNNGKIRVLVCGSSYGATYLRAITRFSKTSELVGILGKGGQSSRSSAARYNVPCFRSVEQALEATSVDLVCVAVGGEAGINLARKFLARGLPVIQEHPLSANQVRELQWIAAATGSVWHINSHFADLTEAKPFVAGCQQLSQQLKPLFINATVNPRTLFSTLDMIARCLPAFQHSVFHKLPLIDKENDFLSSVYGQLSGAITTIQCQRTVSAVDDGSNTLVSHHIEIGFESGVMEYCDTFGPTLWRPNPSYIIPKGGGTPNPFWNTFPSNNPPGVQEFQQHRDQANAEAIDKLWLHFRNKVAPPEQNFSHQFTVAQKCDELTTLFGPPIVV